MDRHRAPEAVYGRPAGIVIIGRHEYPRNAREPHRGHGNAIEGDHVADAARETGGRVEGAFADHQGRPVRSRLCDRPAIY